MREPMAIGRIYRTPEQACIALRDNGFKPTNALHNCWKLVFERKIWTATVAVIGTKFRTQVTVVSS